MKVVGDNNDPGIQEMPNMLEGVLRVAEPVGGAKEVDFVSVRSSSIQEETDARVSVKFLTTTS